MKKNIYLDYAAATPLDPRVMKAMESYLKEQFYNPSALYLAGRDARLELEKARASIADCLGARPTEIIFTSGATESNNLAIQGVMRQFPEAELLASAIEHKSVLAPARLFRTKQIPVTATGLVRPESLVELISNKTVLVSIGMVNNELGTVQPLRQIASAVKDIRKKRQRNSNKLPLYLHSDAAQAGNFLDLHVSRLGVDLMTINGGKIYGPRSSGLLYVKTGLKLQPLILGGGQEMGLRSGTENLAAAVGLAVALGLAQKQRVPEARRINALRYLFLSELKSKLPEAHLNGPVKNSAPHIVSVTLPGQDNERLVMELDEHGIQAASGSACSAASVVPSHVLKAIGLSDGLAKATLRLSFGRATTQANIYQVIDILRHLRAN
ncbi:cysteine desulfurase [Candidatus Saccharibacteria bacterium]|nr:cysteine desulfurase [Candidatus Saccharibacteria bacterium]